MKTKFWQNGANFYSGTRKKYNALIANCTNGNLQFQIENLRYLDWFRREKKGQNKGKKF